MPTIKEMYDTARTNSKNVGVAILKAVLTQAPANETEAGLKAALLEKLQVLDAAGATPRDNGTYILYDLHLLDHEFQVFTVDVVKMLVQYGGRVENYPAMLTLTPNAYGKDVPSFMPNGSAIDEEGKEVVLKWSEYKDATHSHYELNGKHYIPLNTFGVELTASEWVQATGVTGINAITIMDWLEMQPVTNEE